MDATPRDAVVLGLVQSITYVLPVSSDGHVALMDLLFGLRAPTPLMAVALRFAALVSTAFVLRYRFARLLREGVLAFRYPDRLWTTSGGRDAVVVVFASFPTALFGLFLREPVSAWARSPLMVGIGLLGTSAWLLSTLWLKPGKSEFPGLLGSILIGVAQGLSILPGLSRSAGTIACALWLGVRPDRAFELSFLASLPPLLAVVVLDARALSREPIALTAVAALLALLATAVALG
ncbi:MAG TPA: undecaprenyl-diphosphate phosphatase, partial [Polyangiaceae bacterium]|nr:undecaprenyl-diphosphate phosphatase [Polyangiaceae bacterium]